MKSYKDMTREELSVLKEELERAYKAEKDKGLKLDMSRGKPSAEQLDLTMPMLDVLDSSSDLRAQDGTDVRNYGVLASGIPASTP